MLADDEIRRIATVFTFPSTLNAKERARGSMAGAMPLLIEFQSFIQSRGRVRRNSEYEEWNGIGYK